MNAVANQSAPHADPLPAFTAHPPITGLPVGDPANSDCVQGSLVDEPGKSMLRKAILSVGQMNDYLAQGISILVATLLMVVAIEAFSLIVKIG